MRRLELAAYVFLTLMGFGGAEALRRMIEGGLKSGLSECVPSPMGIAYICFMLFILIGAFGMVNIVRLVRGR